MRGVGVPPAPGVPAAVVSLAGFLGAVVLLPALLAAPARAQTLDVTVQLTPVQAPLRTGVTHRNASGVAASSVSLEVINNRANQPLRLIEFTLPANYLVSSTAVPSGWSVHSTSGRVVQLRTTTCTGSGIAAGTIGRFVLSVTPPVGSAAQDMSESLSVRAGSCSRFWIIPIWIADWTANPVAFLRRVLRVSAPSVSNSLVSSTVSWPIANLSNSEKTVTLEPGAVPGLPTPTCTTATLQAGQSTSISCTYSNPPSGSYSFAAGANAGPGATALGWTANLQLGVIQVAWRTPARAVKNRPPYDFALDVFDSSSSRLRRVSVIPPAGWIGATATAGTSGLAPSTNCTPAGAACWEGPMSNSATTATLRFSMTGVPDAQATGEHMFIVRLTPTSGATADAQLAVTLYVPLPDVVGFTVLSTREGQVLSWTNADRSDARHDGVVVFRSLAPAVPPRPTDFVDYRTQPVPELFHVDASGAGTRDLPDGVGRYNYRICQRDQSLVYSDCSTGFWNADGYADSAEAPPGGWTHQLGGVSLQAPMVLTGQRVGIPTNRPSVNVLDATTGERIFDPIALPSLPSTYMPITRLLDGRLVTFAADMSGAITAIDLESGEQYWPRVELPGESFTAGVSGITRSYAAPTFQAVYPMEAILLLGSTTGHVIAIDATTGGRLWTLPVGDAVRALITYDAATNRIFVPTGHGIVAYHFDDSVSPNDPPKPVAGWGIDGGSYTLHCTRGLTAGSIACVDRTGVLNVLDSAGVVRASVNTGLTSPTTLVRIAGAAPGFVVGNVRQVRRISATGPYTLSLVENAWPGSGALSPALVFTSMGHIIVASSDGYLHRLRLSDGQWVDRSPTPLPAVTSPRFFGAIAYEATSRMFVFGTSEGRVWAIPQWF